MKAIVSGTIVGQPVLPECLYQGERANNVGAHEFSWPQDGAIDMGLCGKVGNGVHTFLLQQAIDQGTIAYIALDEAQIGFALQFCQVAAIACIGEGVQHNGSIARILLTPVVNKV